MGVFRFFGIRMTPFMVSGPTIRRMIQLLVSGIRPPLPMEKRTMSARW